MYNHTRRVLRRCRACFRASYGRLTGLFRLAWYLLRVRRVYISSRVSRFEVVEYTAAEPIELYSVVRVDSTGQLWQCVRTE